MAISKPLKQACYMYEHAEVRTAAMLSCKFYAREKLQDHRHDDDCHNPNNAAVRLFTESRAKRFCHLVQMRQVEVANAHVVPAHVMHATISLGIPAKIGARDDTLSCQLASARNEIAHPRL